MNRSPSDELMDVGPLWGIAREVTCPVCKKQFCMYTQDWYWRNGDAILCSYHCMRQREREEAEKAEHKRKYGKNKAPSSRMERELQMPKYMTHEEREHLAVRMRNEHYSYSAISSAIGYSEGTVKKILNRYGIKGISVVTDDEVAGYKRLKDAGLTVKDIAKRYKRAECTVRIKLKDYENKFGIRNSELGIKE